MKPKISSIAFALLGAALFVGAAMPALSLTQPGGTQNGAERRRRPNPPAPSTPNPNCTIILPVNPLSAEGLATPYRFTATDPANGECNEANAAQSAFVQAAILDPASGAISIYSPLVIDRDSSPAIAPVKPTLPAGAIVALWFGYDGTNLTLQASPGGNLADAHCVNGIRGNVFTQFAYCNAPEFFAAANSAVQNGKLHVPPLERASDGATCPTVRDFFIVDQDQSDNLPTMYLATASGRIAQDTAANRAALPHATPLGNPSDNRLLDVYVDPVIGCHAWNVPDLADPGKLVPGLALNEIQARLHQATPVALVPLGDPMAEINGAPSLLKTDAYRIGVDQPPAFSDRDADTGRYCRQMLRIAPARMMLNETALTDAASPDPDTANSLYAFMAQRFVASYELLNCKSIINQTDPVSVVTDAAGVAISTNIDSTALATILGALEPTKLEDDTIDSAARSR
jgi:hypothetical protein